MNPRPIAPAGTGLQITLASWARPRLRLVASCTSFVAAPSRCASRSHATSAAACVFSGQRLASIELGPAGRCGPKQPLAAAAPRARGTSRTPVSDLRGRDVASQPPELRAPVLLLVGAPRLRAPPPRANGGSSEPQQRRQQQLVDSSWKPLCVQLPSWFATQSPASTAAHDITSCHTFSRSSGRPSPTRCASGDGSLSRRA
jgi:hypothetical protein